MRYSRLSRDRSQSKKKNKEGHAVPPSPHFTSCACKLASLPRGYQKRPIDTRRPYPTPYPLPPFRPPLASAPRPPSRASRPSSSASASPPTASGCWPSARRASRSGSARRWRCRAARRAAAAGHRRPRDGTGCAIPVAFGGALVFICVLGTGSCFAHGTPTPRRWTVRHIFPARGGA